MIVAIYSNIAIFVQVFVGSVGYSIYCDIPTNRLFCRIGFGQIRFDFLQKQIGKIACVAR